jgi:hypothetical protein
VIAFDAGEPLWHNQRLNQTVARNIAPFGYRIKSFALSMIETAVELTEGRVTCLTGTARSE